MNEISQKMSVNIPVIRHLDRVAASLLALCPVLQHYQGPLFNMALTVMVLLVPYLMCRVVLEWKNLNWALLKPIWALVAYMIFRVVDHGTSVTELGQACVLILYFAVAALGCIDIRWMCRTAMVVSGIAAALLVVQYICFYVLGFHLQLVPVKLLLPSAEQWILGVRTGLASITGKIRESGLYRPSAFFLEPSHAYIYIFPHLFLSLFGKRHGRFPLIPAMVLSLGLVLTTSGMGIAVVCAAWGLYVALFDEKTQRFSLRNLIRWRTVILLTCAAVALVVAVVFVPQVNLMVMRIFVHEPGKQTAIAGRVASAMKDLRKMDLKQWIIGVEDTTHGITHNMPGAIAAVYRHGLIGLILSTEFYAKSIWKLKMPFWLVALVIFVTSFFSAHTHSTVGMMYFVLILMLGYHTRLRKENFVATGCGITDGAE